jgi:hypothetical protein
MTFSMGFLVDDLALVKYSIAMIHTHLLIHHQLYPIVTTDSVLKNHGISYAQTTNHQLC